MLQNESKPNFYIILRRPTNWAWRFSKSIKIKWINFNKINIFFIWNLFWWSKVSTTILCRFILQSSSIKKVFQPIKKYPQLNEWNFTIKELKKRLRLKQWKTISKTNIIKLALNETRWKYKQIKRELKLLWYFGCRRQIW